MRHAGRVMSRTLITEYAWGYHFDPGTNIVDVVINHLRKKVDAKHERKLITTVRGVGYVAEGVAGNGHASCAARRRPTASRSSATSSCFAGALYFAHNSRGLQLRQLGRVAVDQGDRTLFLIRAARA